MIEKIMLRLNQTFKVLLEGKSILNDRGEIPSISSSEVEDVKNIFPLEKFFIFGHARSGTTLLTRLIRTHPNIHCNYQGHFFTRKPTIESLVGSKRIESWLTRHSNRWNGGRDLSPIILRAVIDFIMEREARSFGAKIVGDKSPNNLMNGESVRLMYKYYPDGRLIYIVRDGRDTAISHRFQTFIDGTQHLKKSGWKIRSAFENDPEPFLCGEKSLFKSEELSKVAVDWKRNVEETVYWGNELFNNRFITLRYEDLLRSPFKEICRLWGFLGADLGINDLDDAIDVEMNKNPDANWQKQQAQELIEPFEKGKMNSWKRLFTENDIKIFNEIAGKTLQEWEYSLGKDKDQ